MRPVLSVIAAVLLAGSAAQAHPHTLEDAYQKEFAFLHSEKKALESRLTELQTQSDRKITESDAEIERLQGRLLALQARADAAQDLLDDVERGTTSVTEDADMLDNMLFQARTTLERPGFELEATPAEPEARAALVGKAVEVGLDRVDEGRSLRKQNGSYFLEDGTQKEGELLWVGNVAAYAMGEGALAPAGEGRLQLRKPEGAASADALTQAGDSGLVSMFLFESLDKRVEEEKVKSLMTTMEAGGAVGWVIAVLGLAGLIMAGLRAFLLLTARASDDGLLARIEEALHSGDRDQAIALARKGSGAAARVVAGILDHPHWHRQGLEDAASEAVLREMPRLERFGAIILVIAAVAPLLGLLGTVTGMIKTFEIITEFGTGDPKMLSGGISEALVTTQLGLVVAIPMLLLGNLLTGRADTAATALERTALRVLTAIGTELPDEDDDLDVGPSRKVAHG